MGLTYTNSDKTKLSSVLLKCIFLSMKTFDSFL